MTLVRCVVAAAFTLAACSATAIPPPSAAPPVGVDKMPEDPWGELAARPLILPFIAPGAACPISRSRTIPGTAPGAGDGPIYPVGSSPLRSSPEGNKVLWTAAPEYKGPALIRGARIDGTGTITFGAGAADLRFPVTTGVTSDHSSLGWRDLPSDVRIPASGCYAYQVDGLGFTTIIVFEARVS